ncbi:hypothetical protein ABZ892_03430 [Streptomyces sp. NPDC046924]|uniref:hypothetical protein n=1 Tax=Streptomyces sp. NPDC046924 TaxID=3155136 RepID=UPI0033F883DC
MSRETEPLTAEERRLMLRLLVCLRNGLMCEAEEGRDESPPESAPREDGRPLSERLRELNHWSSHRDGLR